MEIDIVDLQTREVLPPGSVGEIRIAGNVTPGYYKDPQKNAEAIDAQGRFLTGDLGKFEEHGVLGAEIGRRFWNEVLAVGGGRPAIESFRAFRGRDPSVEALLRHSGMVGAA